MRIRLRNAVTGVLLTMAAALPASAQILGGTPYVAPNRDASPINAGNIPRKRVQGTVKSLDNDKRTLMLSVLGKNKKPVEMAIDVGPSLIFAGKGNATFADIHADDPIKVWGEMTVQGGIRAMEITLPPSRMSIPPPPKPEKHKKKKASKPEPAATAPLAPGTTGTGRD